MQKILYLKNPLLILLIMLFIKSSNIYATQIEDSISVALKKGSLQDAFVAIEQKTDLRFLYSNEDVNICLEEDTLFRKVPLKDILTLFFQKTDLTWNIQDRIIFVKKNTNKKQSNVVPIISGRVRDEQGRTLSGVSVFIKDTIIETITDVNGLLSLEAEKTNGKIIVFSFAGMERKEVIYKDPEYLDIVLRKDSF